MPRRTFCQRFPYGVARSCAVDKNIFPGDQEMPPGLASANSKLLILFSIFYAFQLCILLKPAPLKAFRPVKWHLPTMLSTVDVDIWKKLFKHYHLGRNGEKADAMSPRRAPNRAFFSVSLASLG